MSNVYRRGDTIQLNNRFYRILYSIPMENGSLYKILTETGEIIYVPATGPSYTTSFAKRYRESSSDLTDVDILQMADNPAGTPVFLEKVNIFLQHSDVYEGVTPPKVKGNSVVFRHRDDGQSYLMVKTDFYLFSGTTDLNGQLSSFKVNELGKEVF